MNLAFIDIAKAFDKTDIYGILTMLVDKGINHHIIKILESWFSKSVIQVNWNGFLSKPVTLKAGVRQGGILSPLLFSCFIDSLLVKLEASGYGCFINGNCLNSFMYADDIVLLSISISDLQALTDICFNHLKIINLEVNLIKSHCLRIGPRFNASCSNIICNNSSLNWVDRIEFLGITILKSAKFSIDWKKARSIFIYL